MFISSRIATVLFLAAGAAAVTAGSASAADDTQQFTEGGIQAADNFAHATCICPVPLTGGQQIAVVPVLGDYKGTHQNNLSNGNLVHVDGGVVDRLVQN
ncbi:hypothetical protein [Amycolatopsis thailandensis]|uniref:hypothetical protein n=1 Tax=Amycolatopsis thailandensis TaxID=589330 RepID=UPI001ABF029C|nr:hypothetical protein [Amycolatopsis thailandensis]